MTTPRLGGGLTVLLLLLAPRFAAASPLVPDTSRLALSVGPALDAHTDRLASPFRQTGTTLALGAGYRKGGFWVEVTTAKGGTSSAVEGPDLGVEDVWTSTLDVGWVRRVAGGRRTDVRLGASLSALAFVRRHHYGTMAAREYFADLMVPLSVVGEVSRRVGDATRLQNRTAVGVAAQLFRSPFAGTKAFPEGGLAGPGALQLLRNIITLERAMSPRLRLTLTHALTFYDTDRHRPVRAVHQEVRAGVALALGGGGT